jgi:hypothetical protein
LLLQCNESLEPRELRSLERIDREEGGAGTHTLVESLGELQSVNELGIETRGHLHTHTTQEQPDVHQAQIGLLVPWRLILRDEAGDDGVGGRSYVDHLDGFDNRRRRAGV